MLNPERSQLHPVLKTSARKRVLGSLASSAICNTVRFSISYLFIRLSAVFSASRSIETTRSIDMSGGYASAAKRLELVYEGLVAPGVASPTQLTQAGAPSALGPYGRTLAGNPATTSFVGQPTTASQVTDLVQQYPDMSAVGSAIAGDESGIFKLVVG